MNLFPHLEFGLARLGVVIGGVVCVSSAVASHQGWLSALERLASARSTRLPRSVAVVSLFFAATAATCNAMLLPLVVDDLVATALLIFALLLTLANLLHAAYRVVCVREVSTNPKFERLARVPHAANRVEYIRREARARSGYPNLAAMRYRPHSPARPSAC